ncbi:MAG: hypothetical protein IJS65_08980, partial [Clostridia bacterium]|nr:hypothetical protein [Clostridia bacterium]
TELEYSNLFRQMDPLQDPPDKSNCVPYTEYIPPEKWLTPLFKMHNNSMRQENTVDADRLDSLISELKTSPEATPENNGENKDTIIYHGGVKILGELYHTYVAADYDNCIYLIDKHAAHEKMIYNKLLSNRPEMMSQYLLKPRSASLSGVEKEALLSSPEFVSKTGFEVSDAGGLGILVRAIPEYISEEEIDSTLSEIAQRITDNKSAETDKLDSIFKSIACKSAVKAGMKNDPAEYRKLVIATITQDGMQTCPHGRPTYIKFDESVLEKLFKRTV